MHRIMLRLLLAACQANAEKQCKKALLNFEYPGGIGKLQLNPTPVMSTFPSAGFC